MIWTPAVGAALLGGAGWLLGPLWAVAGVLVGAIAALAVLLIMVGRAKPDPALLLRSGRPQEAYRHLQPELAFVRTLVIRRPMFRVILANHLETMAQVLQALDNEPKALETVTEAVTIYGDLNVKDPNRYGSALAEALLRQAAMLANLSRHGEALAAAQPAVQIYRRLAVKDRSAYLPSLAAALIYDRPRRIGLFGGFQRRDQRPRRPVRHRLGDGGAWRRFREQVVRRVGTGALAGGVGGAFSGFAQRQSGTQILEDTATGAFFGGLAGVPANPFGQVVAGGGAGFATSGGQQLIGNGGDVAKINPWALGIDMVLGAGTAWFGASASDEARLGDSWSNAITGAVSYGTSAECGLLSKFKLLAC